MIFVQNQNSKSLIPFGVKCFLEFFAFRGVFSTTTVRAANVSYVESMTMLDASLLVESKTYLNLIDQLRSLLGASFMIVIETQY